MPITLNCPKCHKPFRVRDESIGGRVRCPSCAAVLQVPATLSPASNFGEMPSGESSGPPQDRPVAEDVAAGVKGTVHELMLGSPGRREPADPIPPPGTGMASPPSIKQRVPTAPPNPPAGRTAPAPARTQRPRALESLGPLPADAAAWRSVHGGLGLIRCALFLCSLVFLGALGHGVWIALDSEEALKDGPGFLKKEDWPRWKEVLVAYTAVPLIPAILLLMLGRMRCAGAPSDSNARGLACGAAFFTFLAFLGGVVYFGMTYFDLADRVGLAKAGLSDATQNAIRISSLYLAIPSAALADIMTVLFIGQIGWPLARPKLQKAAAGFFIYIALIPAGIAIGSQFYPVFQQTLRFYEANGNPFVGQDLEFTQRLMIWGVILLMAGAMFFLRYAGVAGTARRAIRKYVSG
jgi:predicted Zn finger-like uncharacterized protein